MLRHTFHGDAKLETFQKLTGACVGNIVLAPGVTITKSVTEPPTQDEFGSHRDAVNPKTSAEWLYVFGRVEYFDGFKERWMEFCFRYSLAAAGGGFNISAENARYHEYGNATDEG